MATGYTHRPLPVPAAIEEPAMCTVLTVVHTVRPARSHLVRWLLSGAVERGANRLAGVLIGEYAKALTKPEPAAFVRDETDEAGG